MQFDNQFEMQSDNQFEMLFANWLDLALDTASRRNRDQPSLVPERGSAADEMLDESWRENPAPRLSRGKIWNSIFETKIEIGSWRTFSDWPIRAASSSNGVVEWEAVSEKHFDSNS